MVLPLFYLVPHFLSVSPGVSRVPKFSSLFFLSLEIPPTLPASLLAGQLFITSIIANTSSHSVKLSQNMRPKEPCCKRDVWEEMQESLVAESDLHVSLCGCDKNAWIDLWGWEVMLTDSWEVLGHCSREHITELVVMGRHCGRLGSREQKLNQGLGYNL